MTFDQFTSPQLRLEKWPRPKYKLQTMREAVQELVSQEREHLEEEYLDLEPAPKVKETIH